ncbi:MAG: hypothetical protein LAQ69_30620 [Acidobacteriia bacterium]|nr:hypothetical protein [Terriglobia bacterium]
MFVVHLRFFGDLPLPEIARRIHISRTRAVEIEVKTLRKLRCRHGESLRAWLTQIRSHRPRSHRSRGSAHAE